MNRFCTHCKGKTMDEDRECQGCGHPVVELKPRKGTLIGVRGGKGKYLEPVFASSVADAWTTDPRSLFDITNSARGAWYDDVAGISITGGDFKLKNGDSGLLSVKALHLDGTISSPPPRDLYFCPEKIGLITFIGDTGWFETQKKGKTSLRVKVRERPEIDAFIKIVIE